MKKRKYSDEGLEIMKQAAIDAMYDNTLAYITGAVLIRKMLDENMSQDQIRLTVQSMEKFISENWK